MKNNHNQEPPPQNGPPLMVRTKGQAPRTMEELCQPFINGQGRSISPIPIQATDFGLRHHMIQQVQNTCQFHELPSDDANRHIDKFLEITQHMKQNGVSDDALRLSLFPYSLTHHAIVWCDLLPRNSIHSFDDMMRKYLSKYFPPSMVTKLRNEITKFDQKLHESLFEAWELSHRDTINAAARGTFMQKTPKECYELIENMAAHHNHWDTSAIGDETSRNISSASTIESPEVVRQLKMINKNFLEMMRQFQTIKVVDTKCETCGGPRSFTECPAVGGYTQETAYATTGNYNSGGTGSLPSNTIPNPQEDLKVITTRSGVTLAGPSVSPSFSSKEVDREPETITYQVLTGSTNNVPPLVVQPSLAFTSFSTNSSSKMPEVTTDTVQSSTKNIQPLVAQKQNLIYEPIVAPKPKSTIPYSLRVNKQKLHEKDDNLALKFVEIFRNLHFELSFADAFLHMPKFSLMFKSLLNNKEKLFDLAMTPVNENCSAVILKKLPEKLGDLGKPTCPLNSWETVLRTGRALIDVYGEELTLRVDDEAITFKVGQTSKYSYNDDELINRIDIIDIACEEYFQEVLGFSDNSKSGNPTPISDPKLNVKEIKTVKSSIDEPLKLELKDLPSHLEYAYLEGRDKLPVIIAKGLKDDEKEALLKVLKSHKWVIAWKISDIKGIDPRFCTHKNLMEDDFKPTVQSQRRVNLKIHEVIKK
nr:hypothetical protein [Tanacetum cinerariifolium]